MPLARAVTLLEYGEWLVSQDRAAEAAPKFEQAGATFEQLKATPWAERLERVALEIDTEASG